MKVCMMCGRKKPPDEILGDGVCFRCHQDYELPFKCSICGERRRPSSRDGFCRQCSEKLEVLERYRPLRPLRPCERCQSTEFVRSLSIRSGDEVWPPSAPIPELSAKGTPELKGRGDVAFGRRALIVEHYLCRGCGHLETYIRNAADIPLGREHATELVKVIDRGPYR